MDETAPNSRKAPTMDALRSELDGVLLIEDTRQRNQELLQLIHYMRVGAGLAPTYIEEILDDAERRYLAKINRRAP